MQNITVTSIYKVDNMSVTHLGAGHFNITFNLYYPNGIRNSKKALKNLIKVSPELRHVIIEALRPDLVNVFNSRAHSDCYCTVEGSKSIIRMTLDATFNLESADAYIDAVLKDIYA